MKILFVWDSPEYLRFYDSVVEEPLPDSFSQLLDQLDSADD